MTRYHKTLGFVMVTMFGLWGCARGPASQTSNASNDKIRALEAKSAKLEEDLKTAQTAKDQLRQKLSDAQDIQTQQQKEIERMQTVVKERDNTITTRTAERDLLFSQYDGFRQTLKEMIGSAEAALQKPKTPGITTGRETGGPTPAPGDGGN